MHLHRLAALNAVILIDRSTGGRDSTVTDTVKAINAATLFFILYSPFVLIYILFHSAQKVNNEFPLI